MEGGGVSCVEESSSRLFSLSLLLSRGLFDIAGSSDVRALRRHGYLPHNDTSRVCEKWVLK